MNDLAAKYKIPPELVRFIDDGFLVPLADRWEEKCVEFHLPSKAVEDTHGRITSYSVFWIHPDFNATSPLLPQNSRATCRTFTRRRYDRFGDEIIPDLDTVDDLAAWLESMKTADVR